MTKENKAMINLNDQPNALYNQQAEGAVKVGRARYAAKQKQGAARTSAARQKCTQRLAKIQRSNKKH